MVVPSRDQIRDPRLGGGGPQAGFLESEILVLMERAGLTDSTIRTIMGRMPSLLNIASKKVSAMSFELLVVLFPFIMALSMFDLASPPRKGNAFLVIAKRPKK